MKLFEVGGFYQTQKGESVFMSFLVACKRKKTTNGYTYTFKDNYGQSFHACKRHHINDGNNNWSENVRAYVRKEYKLLLEITPDDWFHICEITL